MRRGCCIRGVIRGAIGAVGLLWVRVLVGGVRCVLRVLGCVVRVRVAKRWYRMGR